MATIAAQQIDANYRTINSNTAIVTKSVWTFATATTGAVGAHTVFTVTGNCLVQCFGICDTDLTGAGATIELGTANNTAALVAQTTATDLDNGDNWIDATPEVELSALPGSFIVNDGADIVLTVGTAAVETGAVDIYCIWRPLDNDSNIVAATPA